MLVKAAETTSPPAETNRFEINRGLWNLRGVKLKAKQVPDVPDYLADVEALRGLVTELLPAAFVQVDPIKGTRRRNKVTITGPNYVASADGAAPLNIVLANAMVVAVVDRARREAAEKAGADSTEGVISRTVMREAVKSDTRGEASPPSGTQEPRGKARTPLRPPGFQAPAAGRETARISGSIKAPGARSLATPKVVVR